MTNANERSGRIHILPEHVSHKIAAGEVIDRPASIVRELIDNSIDAGSTSIDLYITEGGMREIRVVDDGCGMPGEDLKLCFLPHATSKISAVHDLERIQTLGFRGEALSGIAATSLLEVAVDLEERKDLAQVAYLPVEHGIRRWLRIPSDATSCATASEIPSRE